jgi:hypothetical protein
MRPEDNLKSLDDAPIDPEACWKLIERVAASSHLNRAPRLRDFLFYVGTKSLKEGITDVHEQEIGSVVFGRQRHYDTSQDNIVRVSATELRKRIDAYFISDGVNEPLNFQIPRGGYKPVFRRQKPATKPMLVEEATPVPVEATAPSAAIRLQLPFLLTAGLCAILAVACFFLWRQNKALKMDLHPWQKHAALSAFWSGFLDSSRNTDIVMADTSFTFIQDITGEFLSGKYYDLHDYLNGNYLRGIQSADTSPERKTDLNMIASRQNGSMGDFGVAQKIESLDPNSGKLFVKFAREFNADSIKRNNTILIGGRKSNPWGELFADQRNFLVDFKPKEVQAFVGNAKPQPGEQKEYVISTDPDSSDGYSVIAYLPNPSHTAKSLIIEGTNSQATNAAGEFITSEEAMESFREKFPEKQFTYFEVLLKTTRLNDTPFKAEIVAYRIH